MNGVRNPVQSPLQNLQRRHLDAGPLGQVGNLRFKAGPGATPRASGPNALQRFGRFLSKVAFYVGAGPAQRAQRHVLDQARDNSRRIGNLLGSLTGAPGDPKSCSRIAEGLARLGDLSGGDLSRLPGGKESLETYLGELGVMDLNALRSGVLGDPEARQAVLDRVDPPRLRAQAALLLDQIAVALEQAVAGQAVQEPLAQIRTLLAGRPVDGQALEGRLARLSENLAMLGGDKLGIHLQALSDQELGVLQSVLHTDRLAGARQALAQIREPDDESPRIEDAPGRQHETPDPQRVRPGRDSPGETMLDRLSQALDAEIQARVDRALPDPTRELETALAGGETAAIARALSNLSRHVGELGRTYGALPARTARIVREQVTRAMEALRDPDTNPEGPLTRDSLARLDDHALGRLRRSGALAEFGLRLDLDGARSESLSRVEALDQRVAEGMSGLLRALSVDQPDMPALMRQLRDLTELELQRNQQLDRMGHFGDQAGVEDQHALVRQAVRQAFGTLDESGGGPTGERTRQFLGLLLGLEKQFRGAASGLAVLMRGGDSVQGGQETLKRIGTTQHILGGLIDVLHERIAGQLDPGEKIPPEVPPGPFHTSLVEQYGVRYDPDTGVSTLTLNDAMRARMASSLEAPIDPGIHPTRTVTLPVRGVDTEFSIGSSFLVDGIERSSLSLSVRGAGIDGSPVRSTWPDGVSGEDLGPAMGEALDALFRVAGPGAEPLTRLMNQQLGGCILEGLQAMGQDSPFRLDDGSVILPVGAGSLHFDVEKNEDGSFRVGGTMSIPIKNAVGSDGHGHDFPVAMKPSVSWAQVQVTLTVSPDGLQVRMSEPPQFRHHFVLAPENSV
ncbi:hypothetical protein BN940_04196 [Castellaniella defragrans 65Phen]|uniref:Uncharacterized protein n=1 Tax=Castellaniella defragrans (strain DSM 12143 / CCUG 39792 / 65Phen) TaxID=1437824 RepID=W8WUD7_CASD6|nr:hypothetical protein [Castellaniella defragrans]CDM23313.1 hypothetical protein BN940_04196 [Castellaniella defragrans 65Phen]